MDPKGRKYATTSADRRKKRTAPPINFSSDDDSEVPGPIPKTSANKKTVKPAPTKATNQRGQVKTIPGKKQVNPPVVHSSRDKLENMQTETDDFCGNCNKIFGSEEIMVCANCSDSFCCTCAKVPEIVADVQFNVNNLKWYCLPCDSLISKVMRDYRNGDLIYVAETETRMSAHNVVVEQPHEQVTTTDPVMKDLVERMNGFEVLVNEIKDMLRTKDAPVHATVVNNLTEKVSVRTRRQSQAPATRVETRPSQREAQETQPAPSVQNPYSREYSNAVINGLPVQSSNHRNQLQISSTPTSQAQREHSNAVRNGQPVQTSNQRNQIQNSSTPMRQTQRELADQRPQPQRRDANFEGNHQQQSASNDASASTLPRNENENIRRKPKLKPSAVNSEVAEREKRKNNIVIHNLPEPPTRVSDLQRRKEADIQEVNLLLSTGMEIQNTIATESTRLGAPRVDGRPRSLLVTLNGDRDSVIKRTSMAREYEDWSDIVIQPDRTLKQRAEYDALRRELKFRKENGEFGLYIKDGQICQRSRLTTSWEPFPSIQDADNAELIQPILPVSNQGAIAENQDTTPVQNEQEEAATREDEPSPSQGIPAISDRTLGDMVLEIPRAEPTQNELMAAPARPSCTLY